MQVDIVFHSYFKDLTGCSRVTEIVEPGCTLQQLRDKLAARFPKLCAMQKSTLVAVGVEYQPMTYILKQGDEVSLFPPVQGG